MIDDRDVWRAAKMLIDRHGDEATSLASQRASEMGAAGDSAGEQVWKLISRAVDELLRDRGDDPVH